MQFLYPYILIAAVGVLLLALYYIFVGRRRATLTISSVSRRRAPRTWRTWLRPLPIVCRLGALLCIIVALARPVNIHTDSEITTEGIDIVLAMDISGSMLARDFQPDRLTAAKKLGSEFIVERTGDRLAVVAFAGEAFTQAPLTSDQAVVETMLSRLRSGVVEDGTAIGMGLATAIKRLRESDAKSKVIILLTDGVNNRGEIAPLMAADIAADMGIKVYTIGIGRHGTAPYPVFDERGREVDVVNMKVEIDEKILRDIATQTGGEYFRATDKKTLEAIYEQINTLEKSRVEVENRTTLHEEYLVFVLWALAALLLEFIINRVVLKRIP